MTNTIKVGGNDVALAWTVEAERRFIFRLSKIKDVPKMSDLSNPKKAAAALTTLLWLLLPADEFAKYETPEDLFVAIDHEHEGAAIVTAVIAVLNDMAPSDEKKSTSNKRHSPRSNSESNRLNGSPCTRP